MSSEQVLTGPIELRYTLTSDDLLDGVAAQMQGLWRRGLIFVVIAPALIALPVAFVRAEIWELSAEAVTIVVVASLVVALIIVGFGLLLYRLLLHWTYRWQARLLLRGNPWLAQPISITVTDSGVHARHSTGESRSSWSQHPLYVETDKSFVLLASKGLGAMALVLPKHGLVGEDAAPLRALLDTHSHRRSRS